MLLLLTLPKWETCLYFLLMFEGYFLLDIEFCIGFFLSFSTLKVSLHCFLCCNVFFFLTQNQLTFLYLFFCMQYVFFSPFCLVLRFSLSKGFQQFDYDGLVRLSDFVELEFRFGHFYLMAMLLRGHAASLKLCEFSCSLKSHVLTLCSTMDCSLPCSSFHGILQARILEWVAIPFFKRSSWHRDQTQVSSIAGRFFSLHFL